MKLSLLLIIKILAVSGLSTTNRQEISYCTLHGVRYGQEINLEEKFKNCVHKKSKSFKYDSKLMRIIKRGKK